MDSVDSHKLHKESSATMNEIQKLISNDQYQSIEDGTAEVSAANPPVGSYNTRNQRSWELVRYEEYLEK